jgi:hypothetical protein
MANFRPSQQQLWELAAAVLAARSTTDPMLNYDADAMGDRADMALEQALALNASWCEFVSEIEQDEKTLKTFLD